MCVHAGKTRLRDVRNHFLRLDNLLCPQIPLHIPRHELERFPLLWFIIRPTEDNASELVPVDPTFVPRPVDIHARLRRMYRARTPSAQGAADMIDPEPPAVGTSVPDDVNDPYPIARWKVVLFSSNFPDRPPG
jgi:hypothetical protein